jgi:thimet oligopeptidase
MISPSIHFPFICNITLEDFRKLWQSSLERQRAYFSALECLRTGDDISSYFEELNAFDLLRHSKDIDGTAWQSLHPDAAFRDEATSAKKAFIAFDVEVVASSAIANNVGLCEASIGLTEDYSKRMLQEWKRSLKQGGAYLGLEKRSEVQELTTTIQDATTDFENNVRNDNCHVTLTTEELKGVPDDYLLDHPVDGSTGNIHVYGKYVDMAPILEYRQVRVTREKCSRLWDNIASPVNEAVLKRLLSMRKDKANLLGYTQWADYQLEGTMAKTPRDSLCVPRQSGRCGISTSQERNVSRGGTA